MLSSLSVKFDNRQDSHHSQNDLCVDANLWVSFLTHERRSEEVRNIFSLWFESCEFFIAPSLLIFEITSALHKKIAKNLINQKQAFHILSDLYEHPLLLFQSEKFIDMTLEYARKMQMAMPYDASYVALAAWKEVPFYTADQQLYKKAKKVYSNCYLV